MTPKIIFIDTSILRGFGFNFMSRPAAALREITQHEKFTLLLPEITEKEIDRQISSLADEIAASLISARKKAFILDRHKPWMFDFGDTSSASMEIGNLLKSDWSEFLKCFEVVRFPYSDIDLNESLNWWENYEPPFSIKKPREFADAFAATCLLKHQLSCNSSIVIVSSDPDWSDFCSSREKFIYFESSYDYAEALNPNVENLLIIKSVITKDQLVLEKIKSLIKEVKFNINLGWDAVVHNMEIHNINFKSVKILNSSFKSVEVVFRVGASIIMNLEYTDIDVDGHVLEKPEQFTGGYHSDVTVNGAITLKIDPKGQSVSEIFSATIDESELSFP